MTTTLETSNSYGDTWKTSPAFAITLVTCTNAEAGHRALSRQTSMSFFSTTCLGGYGARHLAQPQRRWGPAAIIVLTGKGDERIAAATMRAGADDYLIKEDLNPDTVCRSLRFVLARFDNERKRTQLEEELRRLALR